jgi:hypothetical protein
MLQFETITYQGWPDCRRLTNGTVDLVISAGFGPRILRFGYTGQQNLLGEVYDLAKDVPKDSFRLYGGHRLWHAPEDPVTTYRPDNVPVEIGFSGDILSVTQSLDSMTGLQKSLDISLTPSGTQVLITHRITNHGVWPVSLSAWALTVLASGGKAIAPLPPRVPHTEKLTPSSTLVLWSYTSLGDPRYSFGERSIVMTCDPNISAPQKIGLADSPGWLAYVLDSTLFVKQFEVEPGMAYPDFGSSAEVFFNNRFLELESLSPLTELQPGESLEHVEQWSLQADCPMPASAAEAETQVLPRIQSILEQRFGP